jgi:hypothetical protein
MALLNANNLGVYILRQDDVVQTSPMRVEVASDTATATTAVATADPADTIWFAVNQSNEWLEYLTTGRPNVYFYDQSEGTSSDRSAELDLAYAATNSSLDFSTAVDEVVAKGNQCKSSTYTSIGANTWTITCDGLITNENLNNVLYNRGTQIFDMCNRGEYVIVKYMLDTEDGTGTDENDTVYIGQGIIESANISGTFDSTQTYSATIRGYGKLYKFVNS